MIRWAALAALLLLAACVDADPPVMPHDIVTPALTKHAFVMDDGAPLPYRAWLPDRKPRAIILAVHGINDYSNGFRHPAEAWVKDGIATYAYDQRGFGEAPLRGRWVGAWQLDSDLAEASRVLRAKYPGVPLYLLGESMGGAVVITAMAGSTGAPKPVADGVILSAPAVWGRVTMNVFERVALWSGNELFPALTLSGRGLNITPSDNEEALRELSRDPLVIKETRIDTIKGLVDLMDLALEAAPKLEGTPMLLLYGQHDEIMPASPIRAFIAALGKREDGESRIALYEHGYHLLLRDLDAKLVVHDIATWIGDHRAALPSGADRRARDGLAARG